MTSTGYYRLPFNSDRRLPTTLYTFYPAGQNPSEYTKNTRLCILSSTGSDRLSYDPDRSLPTTLYEFYPVGSSPPEYTENTRLCIMTSIGYDRPLYIRSTQNWGSGRPARPARYLRLPTRPSVRIIVPSSPRVLVLPNITAQPISGYRTLAYRVTMLLYLAVYEHNCNELRVIWPVPHEILSVITRPTIIT